MQIHCKINEKSVWILKWTSRSLLIHQVGWIFEHPGKQVFRPAEFSSYFGYFQQWIIPPCIFFMGIFRKILIKVDWCKWMKYPEIYCWKSAKYFLWRQSYALERPIVRSIGLVEFRHNRLVESPHENYLNVCRQHKEKWDFVKMTIIQTR